jgi:hypothetical protein
MEAIEFEAAFTRFCELIFQASGHAFTNFSEGMVATWEGDKLRLRDFALGKLEAETWTASDVGSGAILACAINAIEINEPQINLNNNLVFWRNQYGHANRAHKALLDAKGDREATTRLERILYKLYVEDGSDGETFGALQEITNASYPLIAYLLFLKDADRFMPILPTTFDKAFSLLGIDLRTLRQCSWDNYLQFNTALESVREHLSKKLGQTDIRLVDAHSFCYMLIRVAEHLEKQSASGTSRSGSAVKLGGRETCIADMKYNTLRTSVTSNGQAVARKVKAKDLDMSEQELDAELRRLLDLQEDLCALTGLPFDYGNPTADIQMKPSLDRIDSSGHYIMGNLQVVCRFANFWKGAQDNDEFIRLLSEVRKNMIG